MKFHERTDGLLVVIEGIDGSGKSTLIKNLAASPEFNSSFDNPAITTKEPTRGAPTYPMTKKEELDWFLTERGLNQAMVTRPALDQGAIVLQDRSWHSTLAYQGEHFSQEEIIAEMDKRPPLLPDVLILLDIDPKEAWIRIEERRMENDPQHHQEDVHQLMFDRMQRIRDRYRAMIVGPMIPAKTRVIELDAEQPPEVLAKKAMAIIRSALDAKAKVKGKQSGQSGT